jgi:uncharacterized membrane protein
VGVRGLAGIVSIWVWGVFAGLQGEGRVRSLEIIFVKILIVMILATGKTIKMESRGVRMMKLGILIQIV